MGKMKPCPKCGSIEISTERRPNGYSWCDNGHKMLSKDWPREDPPPKTAKELTARLQILDDQMQDAFDSLRQDLDPHGDEQPSLEARVKHRLGCLGYELHGIQEMVKAHE